MRMEFKPRSVWLQNLYLLGLLLLIYLLLLITLESPLDCTEIKPVNPKGNQPWIFTRRMDAEGEDLILWPPDTNSWLFGKTLILGKIEGKRRREWQRMRWLDSITDSGHECEKALVDSEGQGSLACCSSVQFSFSSVTHSCPTLCNPMNHSMSGLPVHHQLPTFTKTHAHQVGDAIHLSHLPSSPSLPAPNPSQHQGLFQCVNSLREVAKVLEFQLQHLTVLPRNTQDWSPLGWTGWTSLQSKGLSRVFSNTTVQKHQFFGVQSFHSPILTSIHDHRKNYSFD